ncbi:exosome complex component CSL4 [Methanococcoides vulcani]|uniref:Exosome complex component Csl4 n=1 Tax=Methanococcoides vulcani TaxID=1353158 RepID=A0A1H9Y393_9EURY|nr:exosome complex RNA-binding protein Csl4 [Methanococcoides vulcani]SES63306.1 exosome complex component CSL4 [Methanococcoides vulcani]
MAEKKTGDREKSRAPKRDSAPRKDNRDSRRDNRGSRKDSRDSRKDNRGRSRPKPEPEAEPEIEELEHISPEEKTFVLPGDLIGTTEEFEGGDNTFTVRGDIHSLATGHVMVNKKRRKISVKPTTSTPPTISRGDIIVGTVMNVRDSMALVQIGGIKGNDDREFINPGIAAIHVSNVKESYVKEMSQEFSVSDVVKAKIINTENMRMTTAGDELGVMTARCANCGTTLKVDDNKLKCPECGHIESRKLSSGYGTGVI